jgi:hypothetical protein
VKKGVTNKVIQNRKIILTAPGLRRARGEMVPLCGINAVTSRKLSGAAESIEEIL